MVNLCGVASQTVDLSKGHTVIINLRMFNNQKQPHTVISYHHSKFGLTLKTLNIFESFSSFDNKDQLETATLKAENIQIHLKAQLKAILTLPY